MCLAARAQTVTLSAATVATVTLTTNADHVDITNHGAGVVYVRLDGTNPTVAGDDAAVILASTTRSFANFDSMDTVVKLISAGTPTVTVEGR